MKRKIGTIYNKPIVTGDKNLVTKNETHISELQGSNNDGGGSSNIELTKGKKILSEYYYFDFKKIRSDDIYISVFGIVMHILGFNLNEFKEINEKLEIMSPYGEINEVSELGNVILKLNDGVEYVYLFDVLPPVSGYIYEDITIAIRKYVPLYSMEGSGMWINQHDLNNFIDIFDAYIYNAILQGEGTEESINQGKQLFNNMIKDCSITEEEFWAEARIINDINEILQ